MRHLVYETTCLVNGKLYIGVHSEKKPNDGYIGSGVEFSEAVREHGRENFICKILSEWPTRDDADDEEKRLVTQAEISSGLYYNRKRGGGSHGFHGEASKKQMSDTRKRKMQDPEYGTRKALEKQWERLKQTGENHPHFGMKRSDETREKIRQKALGRVSGMKGKVMSEEDRKKISDVKRLAISEGRLDPRKNFKGANGNPKGSKHSEERLARNRARKEERLLSKPLQVQPD